MTDFFKYHGLGNDYLVLEPRRFVAPPSPEAVRKLCGRHRGIGSDGILWGPLEDLPGADVPQGAPGVRIFNPDGSEAEKSGNGLRIFARHLWIRKLVDGKRFAIATLGGTVEARVLDEAGARIAIDMGQVRFVSGAVPMTGPPREVLRETLEAGGESWTINAAHVGNPHCVVLVESPAPELARRVGPSIEHHPAFPNRTNVQFMAAEGEHAVRIEIWERGAGYTEASGTSSCAAAAVACRLGLCRSPVTVRMPGGNLSVELDESYRAVLTGPVAAVGSGELSAEFLAELGLQRR